MKSIRPLTEFRRSTSELYSFLGLGSTPVALAEKSFTGITHDSTRVEPGDLFIALPGKKSHGANFAEQARAQGACFALTDTNGRRIIGETLDCIEVPNPRAIAGELASWFYGDPFLSLDAVGITGTNGKTTTAALVEEIWRLNQRVTGFIGTIGISIADELMENDFTTPEATDLQSLAASMRERHVRNCVMEVSSHGLAQKRIAGAKYSIVGFTQLSQDHLDFHGDMESYFQAKALLFSPEYADRGIVNIDSDYGRRLIGESSILTQSLSRLDRKADWYYETLEQLDHGQGFHVAIRGTGGVLIEGRVPIIGLHNADNALLAIALAVETGVDPLAIAAQLHQLHAPAGRLEPVLLGQKFLALVDFAHTPDAVTRALATVRDMTPGRIIAVLGCGGDRDKGKRPLMGQALLAGSDFAIFTSDNPRSENPETILDEMAGKAAALDEDSSVKSVKSVKSVISVREVDRRRAIATAVAEAREGDSVIILGKGHEKGQEIKGVKFPFDDRTELAQAIAGLS